MVHLWHTNQELEEAKFQIMSDKLNLTVERTFIISKYKYKLQ